METYILLIFGGLLVILLQWLKRAWSSLPLPPGPTRYPIIGNLLNMPRSMPWKTYQKWSQSYGDILYMKIPNQHIVVLCSVDAALDLLDKRSDLYSDRPYTVMNDLMGKYRWNFAMMRYSPLWRSHRREFHQFFNQHEVLKYRSIQLRECRKFLHRSLCDPTHIAEHIRLIFSAIILKITFDMDVSDMNYEYIQVALKALEGLNLAQTPGKFWVDFFPFLQYLPRWIPGAQFKQFLDYYNPLVEKMLSLPLDTTTRSIGDISAGTSVLANLIKRYSRDKDEKALCQKEEDLIRNVTGLAYGAAADTTTIAAQAFFVAMSLYPDVQRKAQEELDRVVGPHRLPEFDDYDNLIYIQAIALESMRWIPVIPLGVPHSVIRDDEYRGYLIPKGATIYTNVWSICHDPIAYPEPERFNPGRFIKDGRLDPDVRNPLDFTFGFGRRLCPGRWLSGGSLFMTIASVLHTLNINPIIGPDGKAFDPFSESVSNAIKMSVGQVPCTTTPRSDMARRLIHEWAELPESH
ncbi:hypothetical protein QCA50_003965 [Cerrena zonata]|uniref:Cytochrome P450 n=1 Tax=Cerrena zonata TaxID=2478898 RepID=A0AAW0GG89_9APHY